MLNGSCDDHNATSTSDNADAYDMTPNNTIDPSDTTSPYQVIWDNDPLQDYIEGLYNGGNNLDEQPGSTSNGAGGTRGIKLYNDGDPVGLGVACSRRIYQKVEGLTIGNDYTFSVDSRSEAMGVPSEVFILNEEISTEVGLENGAADSRVDAFLNITNDFNLDSSIFTNNTLGFTATTTSVVVYIRALGATTEDNEVFYDNFSLVQDATASVDDVFASNLKIYPNPANEYITVESRNIKIKSLEIYSLLGQKMKSDLQLKNDKVDISDLSNGLYLLRVSAESGSSTRKIVIN